MLKTNIKVNVNVIKLELNYTNRALVDSMDLKIQLDYYQLIK